MSTEPVLQHVTDHWVPSVRNETVVWVRKMIRDENGQHVLVTGAFCATCADKLSEREVAFVAEPTTRFRRAYGRPLAEQK